MGRAQGNAWAIDVAVRWIICRMGAASFQGVSLSTQDVALGYHLSSLQAEGGIRVYLRSSAAPFLNQERAIMPKRFRLATLLTCVAILSIFVALGSWVLALRSQVAELEQRVGVLEVARRSGAASGNYSSVGVHYDVDRAMYSDGMMNHPTQTR